LEQLFAKKNNEKVKPPLETRDVPSFLGAHMSSPHMVRVLELLYKTKEISEISFVLEIASFFQPPKSVTVLRPASRRSQGFFKRALVLKRFSKRNEFSKP